MWSIARRVWSFNQLHTPDTQKGGTNSAGDAIITLMLDPLRIIEVFGSLIMEFIYLFADWRFVVCFFAGIGLAWFILETVSQVPLRWMLAGGAVVLGGYLGNRWDRGVS